MNVGAPDQAITWAVIKTVAAFMNTDEGTLLIGIDDTGLPVGVEADYPLVKGGDRDGWELWLTAAVKNALGAVAASDLSVRFCMLDDRTIARIDVRPGAEPVSPQERARRGRSSSPASTTRRKNSRDRRSSITGRSTGRNRPEQARVR